MPSWKKILRLVIKILDHIVNFTALLFILAAMGLSGYSLWDTMQVYQSAEMTEYEVYLPTEEDTRSFKELQKINPEVIGWIRVNDTNINYPLLQGKDNDKYVNHDVEGKYLLSGAIFLDCSNLPDFTDFNSIIYGHHMAERKMFGDIALFTNQKYFDEHRYGNLFFDGKDHGIEFFACLTVNAYDEVFMIYGKEREANEKQSYLNRVYEIGVCTRDINVTAEDRLVLLSTCTTSITNGRDILVGRLTDKVYPQAEKAKEKGTGTDQLNTIFQNVPLWMWVILIVILLTILVILIILIFSSIGKKKKRKGREDEEKH